jgi:hypothetical protein
MGKSVHDNLEKNITYGECCERYLNGTYEPDKLHMICPKCCDNLQRVYSLHKDAEQLTEKIRHTWYKTKRLNRARHPRFNFSRTNEHTASSPLSTIATDDDIIITIKEELEVEQIPSELKTTMEQSPIAVSESVLANTPFDLSNTQRIHNNFHTVKIPHQPIDNNHVTTNGSKAKPRVNLNHNYFSKVFIFYFRLKNKHNLYQKKQI